jgi:sulfate adenylyltransferase subunit 2
MKNKHLRYIEDESIYIIRETFSSFENPVVLYSVGKDSGVLAHLCYKAFFPGNIPFHFMHIDTGYKFPEMYKFRDNFCEERNIKLIIYSNKDKTQEKYNPYDYGTDACCYWLKTRALLDGINKYNFDAAIGGARREEEKSRAKERIFSIRDANGKWNPKDQRPELWNLYNSYLNHGQTMRVFPLSNWTEIDIWSYIKEENIPVVPLYFAKKRKMSKINGIYVESSNGQDIMCRYRSLGCMPCTGAIESNALTIDDLISELKTINKSERENRLIDLNKESAMEDKKKEGYF